MTEIIPYRKPIKVGNANTYQIKFGFERKNASVALNADRYQAVDYNLSFANQKFCRTFSDAAYF